MKKVVNVGDKFGDLEIIDNNRFKIRNSYYFKVKCKCGIEYYSQCSSITNGRTLRCKSCSNIRKRKTINIGEKYGNWEVIDSASLHNKQIRYKARCTCGNERFITSTQLLNTNRYLMCLRCSSGKILNNFREGFIMRLKRNAHHRKINFSNDLTPEYLYNLLKKQNFKCALSGDNLLLEDNSLDHNVTKLPLSLDRIDSNKGYEVDNVQWVTKEINIAKNNLSDKEFIKLCNRVITHANQQHRISLTKYEGSEINGI